ncbi:MAG: tRNA pseudouridine(13) synthase TruD [Candidatus Thermoplasmatota archaeon]|nr:tRNA pseudouridine(13) synthase TruD [Candidatus Thermoplasmatota archaeon]
MIDDRTAGILCYLTHGKGIQGSFKESAEDFIVEELPSGLSEDPKGKYLILQVRLRNWETNKFLIYLSRIFGVSRKRITYAGTKDRVGVTTQYFCINTPVDAPEIGLDDVTITRKFRSNQMLRLGDLAGNRFIVNLHVEADDEINALNREIDDLGGFPNFFAYQRFGSRRPITHIVGKYILKRDFRSAVMEYLCDPSFDNEDYRKNVYDTQDFKAALKEYPQNLMYERAILQHMVESGNFDTAFGVLPKNLQIMFVHAYQSYLFNLALSGRIGSDGSLSTVHEGDIFTEVDGLFNSRGEPRTVNSVNRSMIEKSVHEDRLRIMIPLPGYDTDMKAIETETLMHDELEKEGISPQDFRITSHPELSSSGTYRVIAARPVDLLVSKGILDFKLGRGMYATSYLREIMKENMDHR